MPRRSSRRTRWAACLLLAVALDVVAGGATVESAGTGTTDSTDTAYSGIGTSIGSELVFKAYESAAGMRGLTFPVSEVLGRLASSPNDMVRQFDEQFDSGAQQTDLVLFLDGQERAGRATEASLEEFRRSWRRPKWHLLSQTLARR